MRTLTRYSQINYMDQWITWTNELYGPMNYMDQWITWTNELHGPMNYMDQWITWTNELHEPMNYMDLQNRCYMSRCVCNGLLSCTLL